MEPGPSDNWLDLRKMLESEFWTELSEDDEGIGSDESLERVSNSSNEGEFEDLCPVSLCTTSSLM